MIDKIQITTDSGEKVEAQAPIIISASRSTDIPAFYAKWFINRLKAGYVIWYNPFNQQPIYVSFKNCKVVVFWSKNPRQLMPILNELDSLGIHYYFQYTLNDYEKEKLESNIPALEKRIETFKELSTQVGKEKVIWRFDPMIVSAQLMPQDILNRVLNIGNQLRGYTDKFVFSFIDINAYRKVQNNLVKEYSPFTKATILNSELTKEQILEIAEGLVSIQKQWKSEDWEISFSTCAEKIDLERFGIEHNRCIDGELMKRLFKEDSQLVYYLSYGRLPDTDILFTDQLDSSPVLPEKLKDKGQRKFCGCMISKDIGMYNTCSHFCLYCYANTSKEIVVKNRKFHNENSESIIS